MGPEAEVPEGYSSPKEYPSDSQITELLVILVLIITVWLFFPGPFESYLQSFPFELRAAIDYVIANWQFVGGILLFLIGLVVIHESIHYTADVWQGFEPQFGVMIRRGLMRIPELTPYVISLGQIKGRRPNVISLLAPLVLIDVIAVVGLLPIMPDGVVYLAKISIVVNTSLSIGDISNSIRVLNYPEGTVFQNVIEDGDISTYYYLPDGCTDCVRSEK